VFARQVGSKSRAQGQQQLVQSCHQLFLLALQLHLDAYHYASMLTTRGTTFFSFAFQFV
jgi:hypothetical protein